MDINELIQVQAARIAELEAENAALKKRVRSLEYDLRASGKVASVLHETGREECLAIYDELVAFKDGIHAKVTQQKTEHDNEVRSLDAGIYSQGRQPLLITREFAEVQNRILQTIDTVIDKNHKYDNLIADLINELGNDLMNLAFYTMQVGNRKLMQLWEGDGRVMAVELLRQLENGKKLDSELIEKLHDTFRLEFPNRPPSIRKIQKGLPIAWRYRCSGRKMTDFAQDANYVISTLSEYDRMLRIVEALAT